MFFNNATFFRFPLSFAAAFDAIEDKLAECALKPVGPGELQRQGFVSPFGEDTPTMHHRIGDAIWFTLGTEFRILPSGVVNRALQQKIKAIEASGAPAPGGRTRKRLKEDVLLDLLPKAFIERRAVNACVLLNEGLLIVDSSSKSAAEGVVHQLRAALGSFPAIPVNPERSARAVLTGWLGGEPLPAGLALQEECELKDMIKGGAVIRCQNQELLCEEVTKHLESGKQCTRVGILFNEHVSAVVDENIGVRKIKFLDSALEQLDGSERSMQEELDARFALFTGEIRKVFQSLEVAFAISPAEPLFERKAA